MNLLERLLGKKKEGSGAINTASPTAPSRPAPQQNYTDTEKKHCILISKCLEVLKDQMNARMNESAFVPCSVSCDFPGTKNKALLRVIPDESDKAICRLTASAVRKGSDLCVMNYLFKGTRQEMKEWLSADAHVEELIPCIAHLSESLDSKLN